MSDAWLGKVRLTKKSEELEPFIHPTGSIKITRYPFNDDTSARKRTWLAGVKFTTVLLPAIVRTIPEQNKQRALNFFFLLGFMEGSEAEGALCRK